MKKIYIALLILFCIILPLTAQSRGSEGVGGAGAVEIMDARGDVVGKFTEAYALVIAESEYTNGWRRLPGVKEDFVAVKTLFMEQGFNVETIENANNRNLRSGITNFLDKYGYNPDFRIVLYFAGHGATVDLDGRKMGYIVPVDAPPARNSSDFLQTVIPMTQFETWAKQYTSRHILFIFDSCFAGSVFRSQGSTPPAINRLINQPVRQFITSGDANEEVPDESIFRREFEHALRNGAADMNKDGYVSGTELGLYLFDRVSNYMNGKQNPRVGKLNDTNLDKGDFIFTVGNSHNDSLSAFVPPPRPTPVQNPLPEKGSAGFFIGTWKATINYNNSYDTYRISFSANGRDCTVTISNDNAEQETNGNWSWDNTTKRLKLNAVFRNAKISYRRNIEWISAVLFDDDNNSFNILAKPAANVPNNVRFTFYRE